MINLNKQKNKTNGFTLVETLVALFIFSLAVLTVMAVLSQGIKSTSYVKNKVVAEYLAQEGIEYFRNMRDTYSLYSEGKDKKEETKEETEKEEATESKNMGWNSFLQKLKTSGCENGCYFGNDVKEFFGNQITTTWIDSCSAELCPRFRFNQETGVYGYIEGEESIFSRKMIINQINDDSIYVISEVTFNEGGTAHTISLAEGLFNWIE